MSDPTDTLFVLPSEIPFAELSDADLEECVFWLIDAMGARDLEWRKGSAGRGAADGGRDLEAIFYDAGEGDELTPRRWWVECKGRKDTLEREAVWSAVMNAQAATDLDVLVVATNSLFTNPTRDWVRDFQRGHPRPAIRLWDRHSLERLLSRQPAVVSRLFHQALSPAGRLRAVEERFWNKLEFTRAATLAQLWAAREELHMNAMAGFALVANEFAGGCITERPWGGAWAPESRLEALQAGLLNTPYLLIRSAKLGVTSEPLVRGLAYLILACLDVFQPAAIAELTLSTVREREGVTLPDQATEMLLLPVLNQLLSEVQDVCTSDCLRLWRTDHTLRTDEGDEVEDYWIRLSDTGKVKPERPDRYVRLERTTEPCVVGFPCDEQNGCPLFKIDPGLENLPQLMNLIEKILTVRKRQTEPLARRR